MPSGYTSKLITEDQSFRDFTLSCCRAFGICMSMRDEPLDKQIPDSFEVSPYHLDKYNEYLNELEEFKKTTQKEKELEVETTYQYDLEYARNNTKEKIETKLKYDIILNKVRDWEPPTSEHVGLKDFMIEQIESSIKWDCGLEYCNIEKVKKMSPDDWYENKIESIEGSIKYHKKQYDEETERTLSNNKWITDLKNSL